MSQEVQKKHLTPPKPVMGVEYINLPEDRPCQKCGHLVLAGQTVVRRTARGAKLFEGILPARNGICLNCAADGLSQISVQHFEQILKQIETYTTLSEKKEVTDVEAAKIVILETRISNLQEFIDELSDFVKHSEECGVVYYDEEEDG